MTASIEMTKRFRSFHFRLELNVERDVAHRFLLAANSRGIREQLQSVLVSAGVSTVRDDYQVSAAGEEAGRSCISCSNESTEVRYELRELGRGRSMLDVFGQVGTLPNILTFAGLRDHLLSVTLVELASLLALEEVLPPTEDEALQTAA